MISLCTLARDTLAPHLRSLSLCLDRGAEHAEAQGLSPDALLEARLAPDMYPLATQIQIACHHAQDGPARLMGRAPPAQPTPPAAGQSWRIEEMKALIAAAATHVEDLDPAAFEGAAERPIEMPLMAGLALRMTGAEFLTRWTFAHFNFHVVTAYDILRNQGAPLSKRDFVAHLGPFIRQT
jgi:hypothetical protein